MFCHHLSVVFSLFFIGTIVCQSDNDVSLAPLKDELISLRTLTEKLQEHILQLTKKNAEMEVTNLQQEKQILSNIRSIEIQGGKIQKNDDDFRRLRRELKHMKKKCKPFLSFPSYEEPQKILNSFVSKQSPIGNRQSKRSQRPVQLNLSHSSNGTPIQTKRASTSPQFFTAENTQNMHVSPKQIVRFNHVVTNDGQGYDASNGIFTANSNGV
ncbi:uncharacterized protein [Mytilus edulis]|uniref:uncharacterized protein n=1 Tax=Mytilus edulis TaxID=6550 RepID=UPI0039F0A47A